jgi:hypothetical protein
MRPHLPLLAALWLASLGVGNGQAEDERPPAPPPFSEQAAWLGLAGLPVAVMQEPDFQRVRALDGMGVAWAETQPIRWGDVEPRSPDSPLARYDWRAIDDTVLSCQRAGFTPLLVLSPTCSWAQIDPETCDWTRFVRQRLPEAEVAPALASAVGVLPPRPEAYKHWQRFVRDLVERYDGDGTRDVPSLLRPVVEIQVLDQVQRATRWRGSAEDYQRLLHFARAGAEEASPQVNVMHAAVDLRGLFHAQDGEPDRWLERLEASVPATPAFARLELRRGIELVLADLSFTQLFDGVPHVGSGNLQEDVRNLAALGALLAQRGASALPFWLSQGPTRRLGRSRVGAPDDRLEAVEDRLRQRLLTEGLRQPEDGPARRWLRAGAAYDLVRGAALARAAGASRVFTYEIGDAGVRVPGEAEGPGRAQGFVREVTAPGAPPAFTPTPSWYAARQLNRLTLGHRSASSAPLGAPGTVVVFSFSETHPVPWVAVLLPDPNLSWAGTPGEAPVTRKASLPMPDGPVEIEELSLEDGPVKRRRAEVVDGMLAVELTHAPLYVLPARDGH